MLTPVNEKGEINGYYSMETLSRNAFFEKYDGPDDGRIVSLGLVQGLAQHDIGDVRTH
jgi:hypothetical protein